ncbi:hypothetical protein PC116_g29820, partial [Phytophthora cactorum]
SFAYAGVTGVGDCFLHARNDPICSRTPCANLEQEHTRVFT